MTFRRAFIFLLLIPLCGTVSSQTVLQAHTAIDTLGFTVGPRLFQQTHIDSLAKADVHVDSLIAYPSTIRVTEGASFELNKMYVIAIDSGGQRVPGAPLQIELKAFNCTLGTERIMGFRRGTAKLLITSLLPRKEGKTRTGVEIDVEVTPWPN